MILSQSVLKVNPIFDHKSFRDFSDSVETAVHTLNFKITDYFLEHAGCQLKPFKPFKPFFDHQTF